MRDKREVEGNRGKDRERGRGRENERHVGASRTRWGVSIHKEVGPLVFVAQILKGKTDMVMERGYDQQIWGVCGS